MNYNSTFWTIRLKLQLKSWIFQGILPGLKAPAGNVASPDLGDITRLLPLGHDHDPSTIPALRFYSTTVYLL